MIWSSSDLILPRAACAELIALCCAVCLLAMTRPDRQYGCNLRENKRRIEREDNPIMKAKRRVNTYIPVGAWYRMIPGTAVCSK